MLDGSLLRINRHHKFLLIAPELAKFEDQAKVMAGVTPKIHKQHHNLAATVFAREEKNIEKLLPTINNFTDPFLEKGSELFNLVIKVVMPEKTKEDLYNQSKIGRNLFDTFVQERIKSGKVNFWSPMKKN